MINLQQRSAQKELLDAAGIPFADIKKNMRELDTINRLLGGHAITLRGMKALESEGSRNISVCEIGCGGGDNLRAIHSHYKKKNSNINIIGVDIKQECIDYAASRNESLNGEWICDDYSAADFRNGSPHIIFSSLFCHHFTHAELVRMMRWMHDHCSTGFFINDLHRHPLAYYSIKWITSLFSRSYLVKHDAPLSVARGFKKSEWKSILQEAGISNYSVQWKWAFRHLIVVKKNTA